jgi:hypothetical protein
MKKEKNKKMTGKIIFAGIIAAIIVGGAYVAMNMGNIIQGQVEKIASSTLQVPVRMNSLDIKLAEKSVTVNNLTIANPRGFQKPMALEIGSIQIELESASKELVVFKKIAVNDTNITFEANNNGTNFSALKKNLPAKKADAAPKEGAQTKVIIRDLQINQAQLEPAVLMIDLAQVKPITLPNIRLTHIGTKEQGVLASEAMAQVIAHISTVANKSAANAGFLTGLPDDVLKNMDINSSAIKSITDGLSEKLGNGISDGLKNMFGN